MVFKVFVMDLMAFHMHINVRQFFFLLFFFSNHHTRPGYPTLPDTEEGPNDTVYSIRAGASSIVSTIEMAGLQRKSINLIEAVIQLFRANEKLREAVEACDVGMIEGYPDLEINSMDKFVTNPRRSGRGPTG